MKAFASAAALALTAASAALAQPGVEISLPVDRPVTIRGVEVACTGIGQTRDDPNWRAYPVRVEFSDHDNAYLGGGELTLFADRKPVLAVRCDAPWILLKPAVGAYTVEGRVPGAQAKPRSARFQPPAHGQMRVVLQFPEL
jgi:hypothetical protein